MSGVLIGALMALSLVQQTDTIVELNGATGLEIENAGGRITVTTWDRPEIRIRAQHSSRIVIAVERRRSGVIELEAETRRGNSFASIVDYDITMPASLDLDLEGWSTDVTVEGANGEVTVETFEGDITIVGGRGSVTAETTTGKIRIEDAEGVIEASSVAESMHSSGSSGEIFVESVGGNITLADVSASVVEAGTVGGRISYSGSLDRDGEYFFGSHGGSITIEVPEGTDADVSFATIHGSISTNFSGVGNLARGQRNTFTIGSGGAVLEAETFGGRIVLRRGGSETRQDVR